MLLLNNNGIRSRAITSPPKNSNIYDVFIALYGDPILCMKFYGTATTVDDLPRASSILLCLLQAKTHTKKQASKGHE